MTVRFGCFEIGFLIRAIGAYLNLTRQLKNRYVVYLYRIVV